MFDFGLVRLMLLARIVLKVAGLRHAGAWNFRFYQYYAPKGANLGFGLGMFWY